MNINSPLSERDRLSHTHAGWHSMVPRFAGDQRGTNSGQRFLLDSYGDNRNTGWAILQPTNNLPQPIWAAGSVQGYVGPLANLPLPESARYQEARWQRVRIVHPSVIYVAPHNDPTILFADFNADGQDGAVAGATGHLIHRRQRSCCTTNNNGTTTLSAHVLITPSHFHGLPWVPFAHTTESSDHATVVDYRSCGDSNHQQP